MLGSVWVRGTAIRPVPSYAKVAEGALDGVRENLSDDDDAVRTQLDEAFDRFEREQPALAAHVGDVLGRPLDETALALGYFLTLVVWMAFERAHGGHVEAVTAESIVATSELLDLDEQLRRKDPAEAIDTDDVIAMEQPALLDFVHEHLDATLEAHADDVDVDDVHTVYRLVLVEILALSYAVQKPVGYPVAKTEMLA
ncbi:MAG TPA: hypothetical protein VHE30_12895 [Polyangiaceae bacterium]|nr:hypothetical protein [Polyangiaceae bacterium]